MSVYRELDRRIKRAAATFEPCLPRKANAPPSGPGWIHEIKHDGFRILAQKDGDQVKLITRNGYDFADCCRLIVDAIANLSVKSCIIDDKAIVVDQNGLSVFDLIRRYRRHDMQLPCAPSTLSYQTRRPSAAVQRQWGLAFWRQQNLRLFLLRIMRAKAIESNRP